MLPVLDSSGQTMDLVDAHSVLSLSFAPGRWSGNILIVVRTLPLRVFRSKIFPRLHVTLENVSHPTQQKKRKGPVSDTDETCFSASIYYSKPEESLQESEVFPGTFTCSKKP